MPLTRILFAMTCVFFFLHYACADVPVATSPVGKVEFGEVELYADMFRVSQLRAEVPSYFDAIMGAESAVEDLLAERWLSSQPQVDQLVKNPRLQKRIRDELYEALAQTVTSRLRSETTVTEPEAREFYVAHLERFKTPPEVTFTFAFARVKSPGDKQASFEVMEKLRERARINGLASTMLPEGITTSSVTGDPGKFSPEIRASLMDLMPGDLSPVFSGRHGIYLIHLQKRIPEMVSSYDNVSTGIYKTLAGTKLRQNGEKLKKHILEDFPLEIMDDVLSTSRLSGNQVVARVGGTTISALQVMGSDELQAQELFSAKDRLRSAVEAEANRVALREYAKEKGWLDSLDYRWRREQRFNRTIAEMVLAAVDVDSSSTLQELKDLYASDPSRFASPAEWKVTEIFLPYPADEKERPLSDRYLLREELKAIMEGLRSDLLPGTSASLVVAQYASRTSGSLELIDRGMDRQGPRGAVLDVAVQHLRDGQLSQVTESSRGLHLFRVESFKPSRPRSFGEAKELVENTWHIEKLAALREKLLRESYTKAKPQYSVEGLQLLKASLHYKGSR